MELKSYSFCLAAGTQIALPARKEACGYESIRKQALLFWLIEDYMM